MHSKKRSCIEYNDIKTNLVTSDCEFKWTISNFKKLLGTKTTIKSEEFSSGNNEFSGWFASLKLHNDENEENLSSSSTETYIAIYVNYNVKKESFLKLNFDLSILNDQNEKCHTMSLKNISPANINYFGFNKFITWDELIYPNSKFLQNDGIEFFMKISLTQFENEVKKCVEKNYNNQQNIKNQLNQSLMFQNSDFSDLTIVFDDVNLLVHKAIIADKSEVLYKKIKKLKNNELRLPIPLSIGQELISFIYTGQCSNLLENTDELYETAIRLKIHDLSDLIESFLLNTMNIENALSRLVWAEERQVKKLKAHAINFIKRNIRQIIVTNEFQIVSQNHQNLTRELFLATVENYVNDVVEI
ncbi:speckle-type POZ protein B-like [Leptopilina boulardi]|uniref:speckle-type POZ protein B-like n=1 Tax=Leptopilina boulardi TaxID=63433 RepID=UPI0021F52BC1|nr:speckle-type POZ protein B-like [Leptopilina boulardi]